MRSFAFVCLFTACALQSFASTPTSQDSQIAANAVALTPPSGIEDLQKQKEFFQANGYLWIKNFFSPEQVRLLRCWSEEINTAAQTILSLTHNAGDVKIPGALIVVPESKNPLQVCRTEDMLSSYPDLLHFVAGTVTTYIGRMIGEPYVLFKDKLNFKWPSGGAFPPHQDFPAYDLFGPREHITAMVCIDAATLENGCLQVAENWRATFVGDAAIDPEKLKNGTAVLPYVTGGPTHGSIQKQYSDKITWIPLETAPGDLVLISSYVPHYSEPNQSKISRRAMFFTHNRLKEGDHRKAYYHAKREDPLNPAFHFATPTKARNK